jgi:DNA-binding NarL/FixJ family response regulator
MLILDRLLQAFGFSKDSTQLNLELETQVVDSLQDLAERERRSEKELASEMLMHALAQRDAAEISLETWHSLSPREQQVAALTCLGFTNREIAYQLTISTETVKTHVRNTLHKFNLHSKMELRYALRDWDFEAWR